MLSGGSYCSVVPVSFGKEGDLRIWVSLVEVMECLVVASVFFLALPFNLFRGVDITDLLNWTLPLHMKLLPFPHSSQFFFVLSFF